MSRGSRLEMVSLKREGLAASVLIAVTNRTNEVLEARRQWVKGGEACNQVVRTVLNKKNKLILNSNE